MHKSNEHGCIEHPGIFLELVGCEWICPSCDAGLPPTKFEKKLEDTLQMIQTVLLKTVLVAPRYPRYVNEIDAIREAQELAQKIHELYTE